MLLDAHAASQLGYKEMRQKPGPGPTFAVEHRSVTPRRRSPRPKPDQPVQRETVILRGFRVKGTGPDGPVILTENPRRFLG